MVRYKRKNKTVLWFCFCALYTRHGREPGSKILIYSCLSHHKTVGTYGVSNFRVQRYK